MVQYRSCLPFDYVSSSNSRYRTSDQRTTRLHRFLYHHITFVLPHGTFISCSHKNRLSSTSSRDSYPSSIHLRFRHHCDAQEVVDPRLGTQGEAIIGGKEGEQ